MDVLGQMIVNDKYRISALRQHACAKRAEADRMDQEADEIERVMDLARLAFSEK